MSSLVNFSFFKKDSSKKSVSTARVVVRPLQGPVPTAHKRTAPVQPAVVVRPSQSLLKRKRVENDARPIKKSRSSSADSNSPPPIREKPARASASTRARSGSPSTSRAESALSTRARDALQVERECAADDDGRGTEGALSSADVYRDLTAGYTHYFTNPANSSDHSFSLANGRCPTAILELPARGATEEYILMTPRDPDDYDPIRDMEETLYALVEHYMTPAQAALFGPIPTKLPAQSEAIPASDGPPPLLRLFKRALTRRDGPAFLSVVADINLSLRSLKYPPPLDLLDDFLPNMLVANISQWTKTSMPFPVASRILEESYQRIVRPQTATLLEYKPFKSTVYGELLPAFVSRLLRTHARLAPGNLFLDLGSGVGQVCVQAALETGCDAYGVEIQPGTAKVASELAKHARSRAHGWGVNMGSVELEEGDMIASETTSKRIADADVILVNNKVFTSDLNDALRQKLLDCKEGALVISLQPFVALGHAMNDPAAILDLSVHEFYSGEVSWAGTGGQYYVHRVDRAAYSKRLAEMQGRPTRSRR